MTELEQEIYDYVIENVVETASEVVKQIVSNGQLACYVFDINFMYKNIPHAIIYDPKKKAFTGIEYPVGVGDYGTIEMPNGERVYYFDRNEKRIIPINIKVY